MGIRDRIIGIGQQAANSLLDRVEGGLADLRASQDADSIINEAFGKSDPGATAGSQSVHVTRQQSGVGAPPNVPNNPPAIDPKALYWDPFALVEQLGYKEKPSAITYGTLTAMVWKVPIINAIIQTRINQVSSFTTPQSHRFDTGFRVRLRDREARPTKIDKKFMKEMEDRLLTTGWTDDPRQRDSFEMFLRKLTRDSLVYDQACFEIVPGRDGRPSQWYAVDATTIRLADTYKLFPDQDPTRTKTVQIYDQVIIGEFTDAELAFGIRNPRTDVRSQGYGTSELEMMISTITHILWGLNYNANFFAQGSVAKGLLNLKGAIPEKQLRAFRRQWYQMIAGVENAWRTPIVNAEEIQWVNMQASNRDMEFSSWLDFLIKVATAIYQMDPIEVNFKYGSSGQKCYAPHVEMLMYNGSTKRADEVRVGDQLMGPDSTPRNVKATTSGRCEMFEIVPNRGEPWQCNGKHELTLFDTGQKKIVDVPVEDFLTYSKKRQKRHRLFQPEGVDFPVREDPTVDPYFYGLWVGDGSKDRSQGVVVTTADSEIVEYLEIVATDWSLSLNVCSKYGYRLAGPRGARKENELRTALDALWQGGGQGIDDSIRLGSWQVRRRFLAGFLDADGSVKRDSFVYAQKDGRVAADVAFIARSLGYKVTFSTQTVNGTIYVCGCIAGPTDAIPTKVARKQIALHDRRYDPRKTGFSIRPIGEGTFFGWETDGDHRHLLADFTVSHNSMFDSANKAKLVESKDRGLKPLLRFLGRQIDKYIIWPINPDFQLEFVGLDAMTSKELADLNTQRVRSIYTVNEIRAENDLQPLPDGMGDLILDANWLAEKRQKEEREIQAAQQAVQLAMASQQPDVSPSQGQAGGVTTAADKTLGGKVDGVKNSKQTSSPSTKKQQKELQSLLKPSTSEKSLAKAAPIVVDLEI